MTPLRSTPARWAVAALLVAVTTAVASAALAGGSTTGAEPPPRDGTHLGAADGAVGSAGVSVFDTATPAVTRLDPALLAALRRAATAYGSELHVNSGWRSPAYQQQLLDEAVVTYGSLAAASRWVATPQTSAHVSGLAVDVGPPRAASWLSGHGAAYGLCRTYRNEAWHVELRPDAVAHGCPAPYADPSHDPRMHAG